MPLFSPSVRVPFAPFPLHPSSTTERSSGTAQQQTRMTMELSDDGPGSPKVGVPRMQSVTAACTSAEAEVVAEPSSPVPGVKRMSSITYAVAPHSPNQQTQDGLGVCCVIVDLLDPPPPPPRTHQQGNSPPVGVPRMQSVTAAVTAPRSPTHIACPPPSA